MLSIVIPTLNAAKTIEATLAPLAGKASEIVVVDGGSTDGTTEKASGMGARVLTVPPGRGRQMAFGADAATGEWLLFLHADTVLGDGWLGAARAFMIHPEARARAAAYRLALDDPSPDARRVEKLANWRSRVLGLPYGDQGLLMSKHLYRHIGGYKSSMPLMEDVDMVRRIGRPFITLLNVTATTSAERYRKDGWWARPTRNLACLALYFLGASPETLKDFYS